MPYVVIKVKGGYKVRDEFRGKDGKFKYYSKEPLTESRARAQQKTLYAVEGRMKK